MLRLAVVCFVVFALDTLAVEIIAHRGASHDAPENTLASVQLGWERNADAVEVDVYLSKDGKIVVIHDENTKRTTGHNGLVREMTWAQLQKLDAGNWKNKKFKGEPIPSLSQVLKTIPDGRHLVIEVKCGTEIIKPLSDLLRKTKTPPIKTAIISFSYDVVVAAKKQFPNRRVYFLSGVKQNKTTHRWEPSVESLIKKARDAGLDGLSLGFKTGVNDLTLPDYINRMRRDTMLQKLGFYVWTVNDLRIAKVFAKAGVDGITTDRPALLKAVKRK
jgi:glycerophosphoryl diester phosphodiesterase